MKSKCKMSVIIPVHNEEESIPILIDKLISDLKNSLGDDFEILFIDDGSTDNSYEKMLNCCANDRRIKIIKLRRQLGKSAALSIAFEKAIGENVLTMDADLQDDSSEIQKLLNKLHSGYDLVSGWKKNRQDNLSKILSSKVFNLMLYFIYHAKLHDYNCGLKLYKASVIKEIELYGDLHRFIPALAAQRGFKVAEVEIKHNKRLFGVSKYGKYGLKRIIPGLFDLMSIMFVNKYMIKPLHLFGFLGSLLTLLCFSTIVILELRKYFFGIPIGAGRPLIVILASGMVMGFQVIMFGLLGEMIIRLCNTKNKNIPVETLVNFDD